MLELPKGGELPRPDSRRGEGAWKPGGIEGVSDRVDLVDMPGAAYAVAIMINYGLDDMDAPMPEVSTAISRCFTMMARTTPYGTRVPLEYIKKQ